jgi:hypothetical protein
MTTRMTIARFHGRIGVLCGMLMALAVIQAADPPMKIFILSGQSNLVGKANADDLPPELATAPPETKLYQNSWGMRGWQPLGPYPSQPSQPSQAKQYGCGDRMFGPEIAFGHAMRQRFPGHRIGLVKSCVGGTSVLIWSKDHGSPEWRQLFAVSGKDPAASKPLYPQLVADVRDALATCGTAYEVCAFVWVQAEADTQYSAWAEAWAGRVLRLHQDLAGDIGYSADLPLIVMTPHIQALAKDGDATATAVLRGMQQASEEGREVTLGRVVELAGLADTPAPVLERTLKAMRIFQPACWTQIACVGIMNRGLRELAAQHPQVAIVESGDLPTHEGLHFNAAGQIELGRRLADAYRPRP